MKHDDCTKNLLEEGKNEFLQVLKERSLEACVESFSTAVTISPSVKSDLFEENLLNHLMYQKPTYTGLPFWRDSRKIQNETGELKMISPGKWKCFERLQSNESYKEYISFWTIENSGQFYHRRHWKRDFCDFDNSSNVISPHLIIMRVAEIIATCLSFAKSLKCSDESTLNFCFRWEGLEGKRLQLYPSIPNFIIDHSLNHNSFESSLVVPVIASDISISFESSLVVPVIASDISIPSYVYEATRDLFRLFQDANFQEMTDIYATKLINREFW